MDRSRWNSALIRTSAWINEEKTYLLFSVYSWRNETHDSWESAPRISSDDHFAYFF